MSYRDILLCQEDEIKTYTNLNDNTSGKYILPALWMAQRQDLEEVLGTALVRKLQELVGRNLIYNQDYEDYKTLLNDFVVDFLIYATIVRLIPIVSFKLGNAGAVRTEDEKVYGLAYNEVFNLKDYYEKQADYLKYRMQRFLVANYSNYPELTTYKSIEDLQSNLYSAAGCSVWLGGSRNPKQYTKPSLKDCYDFPSSNNDKKQ